MKMHTVVLGATGFLGLNIVDAMMDAGLTPVCARRRRSNTIALRRRKLPLVEADLDDTDILTAALEGAECVVHSAGHYPRHSQEPEASMALALRQMQNVLDAAAAAGVQRLIYVSSTATVRASKEGGANEFNVFGSTPGFGLYHDLKWEMEALALAEQRLRVVVTCPGACVGAGDLRLGTSALLVAAAHGRCPALPEGLLNPVHAGDVGRAVVKLATLVDPPRRTLLVAGNHPLHSTLNEFAERFGAPPIPEPITACDALRAADLEERRVHGTTERATLVRELVDLIIHSHPIDASSSAARLGIEFTPLGAALDDFVEWAHRFRILPKTGTP